MNTRQAALVARVAAHIAGSVPGRAGAVLAPFVAQTEQIRREIKKLVGRLDQVQVGTVHGLQGDAAAFVILDLTDGPGLPPSLLLRGSRARDPGARLLTVAASRAEHRLIVVGDLTWLARAGPRDSVLLRFLRQLEMFGSELVIQGVLDPRWTAGECRHSQPIAGRHSLRPFEF